MTFHEELTQTVDTLTSCLRDEITRQVHAAADAIGASARADREQAIAEIRAATDPTTSAQLAAAVADAEARAYAFGKEEATHQLRAAADDETHQLRDALRELDSATSLTEILNTLVTSAALASERAAIFLVRGVRLQSWRLAGFDSAIEAANPLDIALDDSGLIAEAVKSKSTTSSDRADAPRVPAFAASSDVRTAIAAPIALAGEVVGVLYADARSAQSDRATPDTRGSQIFEILTRHASRCVEALVAFKAARIVAGAAAAEAPALKPTDTATDDERAARRYARLLVSEIRLYHEDAVAAGRKERDLATRLGGEIARARVMYEERVAADVRRHGDYFYEELVRTLANGDPALLELGAR